MTVTAGRPSQNATGYPATARRRFPLGAEVMPEGGVGFRVWAPAHGRVSVVIEDGGEYPLDPESGGYFSGIVDQAAPGSLYRFRLDADGPYPDPASRFQPAGPHGPSQVIDPAFAWTDAAWTGPALAGQVVSEIHIGSFTPEGSWAAAAERLADLADIGITLAEIMPVADFPGRFGWGYDGVDLFAPTRLYGSPDDFRRFVDRAHGLGLGVILDVVYNHFGPDGNYLKCFSPDYVTDRYKNEWGEAVNFDGVDACGVREFFLTNAAYWIGEFHLDGLRIDATQSMFDRSPEHILAALSRVARAAAGKRQILLIAENEPQQARMVRAPDHGGYGLDALWNDDFHHSAMVALTGHNEAYYTDHRGKPQEFVSAAKYGTLFQGQFYKWQGKRRGSPAFGTEPARFVTYIQNHDQIANSGRGLRGPALTSPGRWKALTALLLLLPGTPMLFQGQEFAASAPFLYFADHKPDLGELVAKGRAEFLSQFASLATPEMAGCFHDPRKEETFAACKLDWSERERHQGALALHRDLLALRREDFVFAQQKPGAVDGAVLGDEAFVLRFFGGSGDDRLLLVNLGRDLALAAAPEPLLAPPENCRWRLIWSSDHPRYGGCGTAQPETGTGWLIPGHAALALAPEALTPESQSE